MTRFRAILMTGWLASTAAAAGAQYPYPQSGYPPAPYPPQSYPAYQPIAPLTDADQLAQQLRILATDPTNVYALVAAGNLSLKVGDIDGAGAFFTRAEKVAPGNPQVTAGRARLLVNAQRPGEALRLFQEAQAAGASDRDFGSDRALAYDLIGEQQRAQREYRAILRRGSDDETIRRYALSLGISGLKEPALALLDPLNRRSDRGAWRARAFVLAMNGERLGAERIATTMMPPGMAEGLRPFLDRLPLLAGADRAFAVHFGEVRTNAARIADRGRVPYLPALAYEPNPFPPVQAAAAVQVAAADTGKKKKRDRRKAEPVRYAATPYTPPLPPPPAPTAGQLAALTTMRLPPPVDAYGGVSSNRGVTVLPPPAEAYRGPPPVRLAQTRPTPMQPVQDESGDEGPDEPVAGPAAPPAMAPPVRIAAAAPPVIVPAPISLQPLVTAPATPAPAPVQVQPLVVAPPPVEAPPVSAAPNPSGDAAPAPLKAEPATGVPIGSLPPVATAAPPATGAGGDAVLAAIVANIQVPESERPTTRPAPLLTTVERRAQIVPARTARGELDPARLRKDGRGRYLDSKGRPLLDGKGQPMDAKAAVAWLKDRDPDYVMTPAPDAPEPALKKDAKGRFVDAKGKPLLDTRGRPLNAKQAAAYLAAQTKDADAKPGKGKTDTLPKKDARGRFVDAKGKPLLDARGRPMDEKQAAAWLAAGGKSPAEAKAAPEKAEPQRYWVQVAGGANEDTLPKEWARVQAQAAALKGRQGWTTPLRATNRVLTGPFKTDEEAMALVNQLKKQGVQAFMFTSDPGQKITRLPAK